MANSRWRRWAAELKVNLTRKLSRAERIFFISDLHIADGSRADLFGAKDAELISFLDHVETHGDKLVILGDAIDFYVARSLDKVIRAHKRVLRRLKELADSKEVIYVYGNHDEDIVVFEDLLNFTVVERLVLPPDILVQHGHEYDLYFKDAEANAWGRMLATAHAQVEKMIGSPIRVPLASHDNRANRIAHWVAYRMLRGGELWGRLLHRFGAEGAARKWTEWADYWTRSEQGDQQGVFREVMRRLPTLPYKTLVLGHSHQPGVVTVGGKCYVNTGTWTRELSTYVFWDGASFTCRDWRTGARIGDELYRPLLQGKTVPIREWWRSVYRGWGRFRLPGDPLALPGAQVLRLPRSAG